MASGKTEEMIAISRSLRWRDEPKRDKKERDRSLRGKDRIRARRTARRD